MAITLSTIIGRFVRFHCKYNYIRRIHINPSLFNSPSTFAETETVEQSFNNDKAYVKSEKQGPITIISLNRPDYRNAINQEMAGKLCKAIEGFECDETASVGILHGIGGTFSTGYDIKELLEISIKPEALFSSEGTAGPTRRIIKKPMICAISGYCISNGFALALMCDLRIIDEDATLGFFNRHTACPLMDGCTSRLTALIGLSRALDLVLTGRPINGKEAFEMGLANRITASGTSLGQAVNLAKSIAKYSQASIHHDRNAMYSAAFEMKSFDQACQNEIMTINKDVISEMKKGVQLFKDDSMNVQNGRYFKQKPMAEWEQREYEIEQKLSKPPDGQ